MTEQPNILFIMADQHNARCLSCAGHPEVRTPALDRLAAEGVRFTQAYTNNPICTPSRMSYLCGQYPSAHGYYGLYGPEPRAPLTSIVGHFRTAGYRTGAVGKLHTPRYWIERDLQFVYDEFIEFPKYLEGIGLYDCNDNRSFVTGTGSTDRDAPSLLPLEHCCERVCARQAIRFIDNLGEPSDRTAHREPWFLWLTFSRPHQPNTPSLPFATMYDPAQIALPDRGLDLCVDETALRDHVARYLGLVSQVDEAIGIVLERLRSGGELEHTIVLYTSDHGDYAGEHGKHEKRGGISYSAICRVPLIIRYPRLVPCGQLIGGIVEAVDVFPTLCALAGQPVPKSVQGQNITRSFAEPAEALRDSALTENRLRKALHTERFRYVANLASRDERDELYDLDRDPLELVNVIEDPQYAGIRQNMLRRLLERVVDAAHPVTLPSGGWHRHRFDEDGRADLSAMRPKSAYD